MSKYPKTITPELSEVLGLMVFESCPLAHLLRAGGHDIPNKTEAEQAFVLHWLIGLALEHGSDWRRISAEYLASIITKLQLETKSEAAT